MMDGDRIMAMIDRVWGVLGLPQPKPIAANSFAIYHSAQEFVSRAIDAGDDHKFMRYLCAGAIACVLARWAVSRDVDSAGAIVRSKVLDGIEDGDIGRRVGGAIDAVMVILREW